MILWVYMSLGVILPLAGILAGWMCRHPPIAYFLGWILSPLLGYAGGVLMNKMAKTDPIEAALTLNLMTLFAGLNGVFAGIIAVVFSFYRQRKPGKPSIWSE